MGEKIYQDIYCFLKCFSFVVDKNVDNILELIARKKYTRLIHKSQSLSIDQVEFGIKNTTPLTSASPPNEILKYKSKNIYKSYMRKTIEL